MIAPPKSSASWTDKPKAIILRYLRERIATDSDPSRFGKPLAGDFLGLWRYRIRDYRLICSLEDERFVVLVLHVGHRRDVYR